METHPLDPLSAEEIDAVRETLADEGKLSPGARFPLILPEEPPKEAVERGEGAVDRRARAVVLDTANGDTFDAVVSLTDRKLLSWRQVPTREHPYGQAPVMLQEYADVEEIVKADQGWRDAMALRGVEDLDLVFVTPLSPGQFGFPDEVGKRVLRSLFFVRHHADDSPWAHPVEGLIAYVDVIERRIIRLVDTGVVPVPDECGNFDEASVGPPRTSLRPLEITQPDGPSFTVTGHHVTWENWRFRISFNAREGLVLHQLAFRDGGVDRQVVYRASIAEMVVPYADPSDTRFWISYFDLGEYSLGSCVNSLVLGCDCLGEIHYFDAVLADAEGRPYVARNAICMHEEDYGVLWKHTDVITGAAETRRSRRLVISFFTTVGNYDYGFYWYLYQDGTIQMEAKLTGVVFTGAAGEDFAFGTQIAPGLVAPYHQHLFCARLDMNVDGPANSVHETDIAPLPMGDDNRYGNAFQPRRTLIARESEAARMADPAAGRYWTVSNSGSCNRLGQPVGYKLTPHASPTLFAHPDSAVAKRAAFATRHLWVTRYHPDERYPAGDYPNQHAGGAGLPEWTAADRPLEDQDLVLWHTFGSTHIPRTEDWPVMPVEYAGFTLKPVGFFDRNPALDLPATTGGACAHTAQGDSCDHS
ncbi:primary-amine oxidase [Actinomadura syzygii]|uniref:Amine oxidase n=1 Tax=Actinomadura syzygii TaxID=1427538 RepID=A0A5D0UFN2_9ACTN|nr:primary-amine oxidase [Actinomadura syzygii]TYC15939.1 primary-amine oxidase [Actinomadura syzygii]